jgi:Right handed beta helix region
VLTPGNYGPVVITKALSIINDSGGIAAISPISGDGVNITAGASDAVYLRDLTIKEGGSSSNGINFASGGSLQIIDCDIHDFAGGSAKGIYISPTTSSNFIIANTIVSNNYYNIYVTPQTSTVVRAWAY